MDAANGGRWARIARSAAALALGLGLASAPLASAQTVAGMRKGVTQSQFFRDSGVLFPAAAVDDIRTIPPLTDAQVAAFEADLNGWLARVKAQHARIRNARIGTSIQELFEAPDATLKGVHVLVTNQDVAEASTAPNGEVAIDVRVLQSLLRAAIVTRYEAEIDLDRVKTRAPIGNRTFTLREQAIAMNVFLQQRERLRPAAKPERKPARSGRGAFDAYADEWFSLWRQSPGLSDLDTRYDAELMFLVAHELGHVALGHFTDKPIIFAADDVQDACTDRREKEASADAYAALLITLSTDATGELFGFLGGGRVGDGFDTFFEYAYDYAGFAPAGGTATCQNYPPPAERLALMQEIYKTIRERQTEVILKDAKVKPK